MIRGVWQLRVLNVRVCPHGGSSRGAREFVGTRLAAFRDANPQVDVTVVEAPGRHPYVEGQYANSVVKQIGVRNESAADIEARCQFLRDQTGRRHVRVMTKHTDVASVQGAWRAQRRPADVSSSQVTGDERTSERAQ